MKDKRYYADIKRIQNGEVAYVECVKDETEIFIQMEE